jgi:hypothetical protein
MSRVGEGMRGVWAALEIKLWRVMAQLAGENEPTPHGRLPARETRTELRRTTSRAPELHGQRNALEIEPSDATLKTLPTNADQEMPTPGGPAAPYMLSHTSFFERASTGWLGRRQCWTRRRIPDARRPEGVVYLTFSLSEAKMAGRRTRSRGA